MRKSNRLWIICMAVCTVCTLVMHSKQHTQFCSWRLYWYAYYMAALLTCIISVLCGSQRLNIPEAWYGSSMMETDTIVIIESVDSINKDGLDTPICAIHYKMSKHSPKTNYRTACYIFAILLQYAHAHVLCLYLLHCSLALDSILQLLLAAQDSDHAPLCSSSLPTQQIKSAINKYKKKFHD